MRDIKEFFLRLKHNLTADSRRGFGVHSPFMFDFLGNVLNEESGYYAYDEIERLYSLPQEQDFAKLLYRIIQYYGIKKISLLGLPKTFEPLINLCNGVELGNFGVKNSDLAFLDVSDLAELDSFGEKLTVVFIEKPFLQQKLWQKFISESKSNIFVDCFKFSIIFANQKFQKQLYKIKF